MKQKIGKITALFLVSIMALAGTSVGYALWSETLYIDGDIYTGELDWEWYWVTHIDSGPPSAIPDYHCNPGFQGPPWQGDKDVGYTSAIITEPHITTLTLHNVYPCYFNMISLYMQVKGTIPLRIQSVTFESDYESVTIEAGTPIFDLDLDGDSYPDIEFWWKDDWFGNQYHPDDYIDEISFWLHIMQPSPEGSTLSFTVTLTAVQWNEYQPPE